MPDAKKPSAPAAETAAAAQAEASSSAAAIGAAHAAAADPVSSDAPITRDGAKSSRPPAPRAVPSVGDDELPQLRARWPRWILPLGVAAAIGLGVIGLRSLDRAPTPIEATLATAVKPPPPAAVKQRADGDDTDTDLDTTPTEPDPLQAKTDVEKAAAKKAAAEKVAADKAAADKVAVDQAAAAKPAAKKPAAGLEGSQTGEALDAAEAANATGGKMKRINIDSEPPGARMYWRGKEVGTTPFVLEIPSGQRRSYELGRQGFTTRKVVIDGSKSDIVIGLKPESDAPAGIVP